VVPGHEDDLACQLGVFIDDAGEDKGPEVSEEVRARLIDPFYTSKPSGKGTGLRLTFLTAESLPTPWSPCREHR